MCHKFNSGNTVKVGNNSENVVAVIIIPHKIHNKRHHCHELLK